jgi:hypothetical protein
MRKKSNKSQWESRKRLVLRDGARGSWQDHGPVCSVFALFFLLFFLCFLLNLHCFFYFSAISSLLIKNSVLKLAWPFQVWFLTPLLLVLRKKIKVARPQIRLEFKPSFEKLFSSPILLFQNTIRDYELNSMLHSNYVVLVNMHWPWTLPYCH